MNCTEFADLIDDYIDQYRDAGLSVALWARAHAHEATCERCARRVREREEMLVSLNGMLVRGPSPGFMRKALRGAKSNYIASQQRRGFALGFGSAFAVALLTWMVLGLRGEQTPMPATYTSVAEISIGLSERQDVKLAFRSAVALDDVRITIELPDDVELIGYPGQRQLSWRASLAEGENTLYLPVLASRAMRGELVARLEHQNKVRVLRVNLKATASAPTQSGNIPSGGGERA